MTKTPLTPQRLISVACEEDLRAHGDSFRGAGYTKSQQEADERYDDAAWRPQPRCRQVLRVNPGYRAHFEAEFDEHGNILSIGQWKES
jgi:hypothetical protein